MLYISSNFFSYVYVNTDDMVVDSNSMNVDMIIWF